MKHKLELVYFKMRALAEAPRLLLHYTELEFNDIMSWDYYEKEWAQIKSKVPFRQLPMLVVDQKHEICQSIAILNFIEKIAGAKGMNHQRINAGHFSQENQPELIADTILSIN